MPQRRGVWAVVLIALLAFVSCRSKSTVAPARPAERPLPTAPAGLLAEFTVAEPRAFYAALRSFQPENVAYPEDPALALALVWGLPLAAAEQLALDRPLYGAIVSTSSEQIRLVTGCRVRSGAEFVRLVTSAPGRRALPETPSGLVVLGGSSGNPLGVLGDWLLVSSGEDSLREAGPYVARALPTKAVPAAPLTLDVAPAALRGSLDALLRARWNSARDALAALAEQAQRTAGRPADFADPAAVLAKVDASVRELLDFLRGSQSARLTATLSAERLELDADVLPRAGGADTMLGKLHSTPLAPLLTLPRDTLVGALFQLGAADLPESKSGDVVGALGRVLSGSEPTTLAALLADRSLLLRREVHDRTETERAFAELARAITGRAPLRAEPNGAERIVLPHGPDEAPRDLWWSVKNDALVVRLDGSAPKEHAERTTTFDFAAAPEAERLAAEASLATLVARHEAASFALIANFGTFGTERKVLPGFFGWGRHGEHARLEIEVVPGALSAIRRLSTL